MEPSRPMTIRQKIIQCLETSPMTAREISGAVRISEKDVYAHLPFIEKSVQRDKKEWIVTACLCLSCGFEFSNRKRLTKPGKCPKCRKTRIQAAVFQIKK